jgi:hypothetical protein
VDGESAYGKYKRIDFGAGAGVVRNADNAGCGARNNVHVVVHAVHADAEDVAPEEEQKVESATAKYDAGSIPGSRKDLQEGCLGQWEDNIFQPSLLHQQETKKKRVDELGGWMNGCKL